VPAKDFILLSGQPAIYVKTTAESGNPREQAFCPKCGTPIYATAAEGQPTTYGVRVGTIQQREQFIPRKQIWARSALDWVDDIADIPRIEKEAE